MSRALGGHTRVTTGRKPVPAWDGVVAVRSAGRSPVAWHLRSGRRLASPGRVIGRQVMCGTRPSDGARHWMLPGGTHDN